MFAARLDDLSLIPGIHRVEIENQLPQVVLYLHTCSVAYIHIYAK